MFCEDPDEEADDEALDEEESPQQYQIKKTITQNMITLMTSILLEAKENLVESSLPVWKQI